MRKIQYVETDIDIKINNHIFDLHKMKQRFLDENCNNKKFEMIPSYVISASHMADKVRGTLLRLLAWHESRIPWSPAIMLIMSQFCAKLPKLGVCL